MATLDTLLTYQALVRILVPTDGAPRLRWIYGFPSFQNWLMFDLPKLEPGRLRAEDPPNEQVDNILYRWITGKEIRYTRQFQDLMPKSDEVWEMKTADIRIFGWMYQPLKFIALFGDYADLYKGKNAPRSYDDAVRRVKRERDELDLILLSSQQGPSMNLYVYDIGEKARKVARFIGHVRAELQGALLAEKASRKLTQQQIATLLGTNRSVINRQFTGFENLTIRRVAELAWALGREIVFYLQKPQAIAAPEIPIQAVQFPGRADQEAISEGPEIIDPSSFSTAA